MAYRVPTLDELQTFVTAFFKSLFPDRNIGSRFSFYWKMVKVITGAVTDNHAHIDAAGRDLMPDTTSKGFLDRWLAIVGSARKGATPSRKAKAGRLVGTVGITYTIGAVLLHRATNQRFQLNASGAIPAAGFIDVDILALSTGSATRLEAKQILEFVAPIAGIATNVELQLALDEDGLDAELDPAARTRLTALLGDPQSGGNQADYVRWLLAQSGVSYGYCYPNRAGTGSVDVAALHTGTGSARFLNTGERAVVQAALALLAPAQVGGAGGALRVLNTVGEYGNVEMTITTNGDPAYAFDWDDTTVPTVVTWTPATMTLQLNARPASMKAGDRIVMQDLGEDGVTISGFSIDGSPLVIESLSGVDSIVLATPPIGSYTGVAMPAIFVGAKVYAGGPLTAVVRDAVIAHLNSDVLYATDTGPLPGAVAASAGTGIAQTPVLLEGIGTSNVGGKYGTWSGTLRRDALFTIARYTRGVRLANIVFPVTDKDSTDYTFPLDAQIGVLTPGYVLIRRG